MLNSNSEQQCKKILNKLHYQSVKKIGKGSFGHVILASKFTTSANFYAIKCISLKKNHRNPSRSSFNFQQTKAMCAVDHPNVVRLENSFQESGWQFIIMQYCDMGNLTQYQSKNPQKVLSLSQSLQVLQQILKGIFAIHKLNIMHRDIKCQNIFLKRNKNGGYTCKIGDFGFAKVVQETTKTACGTILYMAPEIMKNLPYSFEADIWSIGIILYCMLYGEHPFKSINIQKQIEDKCINGFQLTDIPSEIKGTKQQYYLEDLFKRTFQLDPNKRIKLDQIMNHPLLLSQIETASDQGKDNQMEDQIQWELKRVNFVLETFKLVQQQKLLGKYLLFAFKFYLSKAMRIFLSKDQIEKYIKKNPKTQLSKEIKNMVILLTQDLQSAMNLLSVYKSETKKIQKFEEGFNMQIQDFVSIKQGYRNTVGQVFEQIHKKVQDQQLKAKLKFRVFCCHLINRVFKTGVKQNVFPKFSAWKSIQKKNTVGKGQIELDLLEEWINQQNSNNLLNEIQNINSIFYKG